MLGLEDTSIWLAYVLSVASTLLCVIYGILHWNRGDEELEVDDVLWVDEEKRLEKEFE